MQHAIIIGKKKRWKRECLVAIVTKLTINGVWCPSANNLIPIAWSILTTPTQIIDITLYHY